MWYKYFDEIILLNLASRTDRLIYASHELKRYGIPFEREIAIPDDNGRLGVYLSLMKIFRQSLGLGLKKILIFEDDPKFLCTPDQFNDTMEKCVVQLQKLDWHLFKLGLVALQPFVKFVDENILPIRKSYGLHACAYSEEAMRYLLELKMELPFDTLMSNTIEQEGKSYCSYPLLCSQLVMKSDIEKRVTDWDHHIQGSYKTHIAKLLTDNEINPKHYKFQQD